MKCPRCSDDKHIIKFGFNDNFRYQRYRCQSCKKKFSKNTQGKGRMKTQFRNTIVKSKAYVITSAQNATPVHLGFFNSLQAYCKRNKAELIVIPFRYRNPTSLWSKEQEHDEWWASEIVPYLYAKRKKLNENIEILGDIKVQPTAISPLTGLESISRGLSGIVGHPKLQLKVIPTPQNKLPKILTTTGTVTIKNFTDSKAGKQGEFHLVHGAAAVDIVGRKFHLRQINALSNGSFVDLDTEYFPDGSWKKAPPALALVMGDTHVNSIDPKVDQVTFGKHGIVETLNPETLIFHDLFDGYSCNPHHAGNPFINYIKHHANLNKVRKEVYQAIDYLKSRVGKRFGVVISSNHNDFLKRWLMSCDWRQDPTNAEFYLETAHAIIQRMSMEKGGAFMPDPFAYWVNKCKDDFNILCLENGGVLQIGNIECGLHGDYGPNGSRGTAKNLSRLGTRIVTGHGHTPFIEEGHYRAGTSTHLKLEYNYHGPSSWLNSHVVIYHNSRRSILTVIDGSWRGTTVK